MEKSDLYKRLLKVIVVATHPDSVSLAVCSADEILEVSQRYSDYTKIDTVINTLIAEFNREVG
jgi:hypothetical protein